MNDVLSNVFKHIDNDTVVMVNDINYFSKLKLLYMNFKVFGDHGMTFDGNHGGASSEELGYLYIIMYKYYVYEFIGYYVRCWTIYLFF